METKNHYIEKIKSDDINKIKKIESLSKTLYNHRNKNKEYGYYLLEKKPDSHNDIAQDLLIALDKNINHHRLYIIKDETNKEIGYILLKNYSDYVIDDPVSGHKMSSQIIPNIEASYRTIKEGTCTPSLKYVLYDVLFQGSSIQSVMGHHAVANKSSGAVFHSNGFSVVKYHKNYVYLPNLDQYSDTILWKLDKNTYIQDYLNYNGDLKQHLRNIDIRICNTQNEFPEDLQEWYSQMQTNRKKITLYHK